MHLGSPSFPYLFPLQKDRNPLKQPWNPYVALHVSFEQALQKDRNPLKRPLKSFEKAFKKTSNQT